MNRRHLNIQIENELNNFDPKMSDTSRENTETSKQYIKPQWFELQRTVLLPRARKLVSYLSSKQIGKQNKHQNSCCFSSVLCDRNPYLTLATLLTESFRCYCIHLWLALSFSMKIQQMCVCLSLGFCAYSSSK